MAKDQIAWTLIVGILFLSLFNIFLSSNIVSNDLTVYFSIFLYFLTLMGCLLILSGHSFALISLFCLIFFVLIPCRDISLGIRYWDAARYSSHDFVFTFFVLCVFHVFFALSYIANRDSGVYREYKANSRWRKILPNGLLFVCIVITFYAYKDNPLGLFLRALSTDTALGDHRSAHLFINQIVRPLAFVLAFFQVVRKPFAKNRISRIWYCLIMLLILFPISLPRYLISQYYGAVFFSLIFIKRPSFFALVLILISLPIMVLLGAYRSLDRFGSVNVALELSTSGAFDAFQMGMIAVSDGKISFGGQMLGNIFYMIPRYYWPDKPIGSGSLLAQELGLSFTNVSMPLFAEGYLNFGLLGVVIFAILVGCVAKKTDLRLRRLGHLGPAARFVPFVFCFQFLILLRGDFLTGFLNLSTVIMVILISTHIIYRREAWKIPS